MGFHFLEAALWSNCWHFQPAGYMIFIPLEVPFLEISCLLDCQICPSHQLLSGDSFGDSIFICSDFDITGSWPVPSSGRRAGCCLQTSGSCLSLPSLRLLDRKLLSLHLRVKPKKLLSKCLREDVTETMRSSEIWEVLIY